VIEDLLEHQVTTAPEEKPDLQACKGFQEKRGTKECPACLDYRALPDRLDCPVWMVSLDSEESPDHEEILATLVLKVRPVRLAHLANQVLPVCLACREVAVKVEGGENEERPDLPDHRDLPVCLV